MNFHQEALSAFNKSDDTTKSAATPVLDLISNGFQITWFREFTPKVWHAIIKPTTEIRDHFGLHHECLVIGNGHPTEFHQRTLDISIPENLKDRLDQRVLLVASNAKSVDVFCAAWGQKNKLTMVLIKNQNIINPGKEELYNLLSSSLWRRDCFAESEPVRNPSEFFGRQLVIEQLLTKVIEGSPVAIFGLRKIGKSSVLGRLEDLLKEDDSSITATAFIRGNATSLTAGRWWHLAQAIIQIWQTKLKNISTQAGSKIHPKIDKLNDLLSKQIFDEHRLAQAFEKDIQSLLKSARALKSEAKRESTRLVILLDECDHLYPHLEGNGYWKKDFFHFWNTLQAFKRGLDNPEELNFILSGVNPSGVEQGALENQPNPLYETQRIYLGPMSRSEAESMLSSLGERMGLIFEKDAIDAAFNLVGGHPILLRKLGTSIHELFPNRSNKKFLSQKEVERAFNRHKRELFNQVAWFLEHLAKVAPEEERLLRDIATGGTQAYAEHWGENEFRETFAYHLERYGLIEFDDELPKVTLSLIAEALRKPAASEYVEQKKQLKDAIESIELAIRARLRVDLEKDRSPEEAIRYAVNAIPSDAKNRALSRQELIELGEAAGLEGVLDSLNWGDYEILVDKYYTEISWSGKDIPKESRLAILKSTFKDAHLIRHNNDHAVKSMIKEAGYQNVYSRFNLLREMLSA